MPKPRTLSRVVESIYWMGRYLERAESTARLVAVNANLLMDLPAGTSLGWRPLLDITGGGSAFDARHAHADERNVTRFLAGDLANPSSIASSTARARDNARSVRDAMPRVAFQYINELYLFVREELAGQPSRSRRGAALDGVARRVQQIEGFLSSAMLHDEKWQFLRLGNHLERADMTTRIVDAQARRPSASGGFPPFEQVIWRSVLQSLYAMQSYLYATQGQVERGPVLQFLFKNEAFPRSYAGCLRSLKFGLRHLPRNAEPARACERIVRHLDAAQPQCLDGDALHDFVDDCQIQLNALHDAIDKTYFHVEPAASGRRGGATP